MFKAVSSLSFLHDTPPLWTSEPTEALERSLLGSVHDTLPHLWEGSVGHLTQSTKNPVSEGNIPTVPTETGWSFASSVSSIRRYVALMAVQPQKCTAVFITVYINHVSVKHFREGCIRQNQSALKKTLPHAMKSHISSIHVSFKIINMLKSKDWFQLISSFTYLPRLKTYRQYFVIP